MRVSVVTEIAGVSMGVFVAVEAVRASVGSEVSTTAAFDSSSLMFVQEEKLCGEEESISEDILSRPRSAMITERGESTGNAAFVASELRVRLR
jgi:hypothetical protein